VLIVSVCLCALRPACARAQFAADEPSVLLTAAGATFPQPLYQNIIARFMALHPQVKINYGGGGSALGIKGIIDRTLAFAGSDAPMSRQELARAGGVEKIIQIPSCAGGVVPAYNLPGVTTDLNFTGAILADIYLGKISNWNDPQIAAINPGVALPDLTITPAWRSDGSGTTFVLTSYLSTQSDDFRFTIGIGKSVHWPIGPGGGGNPGVAAILSQTAGAIGYIEQNYADRNAIPYGLVRNKSGRFVKASPESVAAAAATAAAHLHGQSLTATIWNQNAPEAYPISSFTYLIAFKDLGILQNRQQAQMVVEFFHFVTHDGQDAATSLCYAPLPMDVRQKVDDAIRQFNYHGEPIQPNP
jgi:phosphate transport system substrate-binding protein